MAITTIVSTSELAEHLGDPDWVVVDCRYSLDDIDLGRFDYLARHIPGAVYAHIDEDLSGRVMPDTTGRHPLPDADLLAEKLGAWGIGDGVQVVAYDDAGGAMAARLWWLLKWLGHEASAVLDGGWMAWLAESRPITDRVDRPAARTFVPRLRPELVASTSEVANLRGDPDHRLLDARAAERYRGENETIDPVAGHIPGAVSAPFAGNLDEKGRFLARDELQVRFETLMGPVPAERTIAYCGSGVTGAHAVLAIAHAGMGEARLYAGSWSEWITDPERPVAVGP